jgi:RNA polymerase sigma-70 factor (ECF subfamily)
MRELYAKSGAARFGIGEADFAAILDAICGKYLSRAEEKQLQQFLAGLRVHELALARGCAAGNDAAWTEFLTRYRAFLYDAALGITRNDQRGRELADSIYAQLYGLRTRQVDGDGEERISKLNFYTGRGSLEGWLRTVLAQEYVDRFRKQRRDLSLEEETEAGAQFAAPSPAVVANADARVGRAVDSALGKPDAEARYMLAAYFLDERTLAEIGRSLGVHESTVSRKLERTTKELRKQILKMLVQSGMSARAAEEALEVDVRDLAVNVRERLRPPSGTEKRA